MISFFFFFSAFYIVGFGICLFLLYNLMPIAMQFSSATVVNLSLLTADFYSLLCGLLLFHYKVGDHTLQFNSDRSVFLIYKRWAHQSSQSKSQSGVTQGFHM